jgi:hypothetical protein
MIILGMLIIVADFDFLYSMEGVANIDSIQNDINDNTNEIIQTNDDVYKLFNDNITNQRLSNLI